MNTPKNGTIFWLVLCLALPLFSFSQTVDFEGGAAGWTSTGGSATTGFFVVGDPIGTNYQPENDHTVGGVNAFYTATNPGGAEGTDDVDAGNVTLESPNYNVPVASSISIWYFFGQRDSGDDGGDYFRLEYSLDGGTSYTTLVFIGDTATNPAWTNATVNVPAGSTLRMRVDVADGTGRGELIEAGIDDFEIRELQPTITIDDVQVSEGGGSAIFTATHVEANASGAFTVNYTTQDGTATSGSDYTLTTGTLNFNGITGDTQTITVPILNNTGLEANETFIVRFTGSSDISVNISDTSTATIFPDNDNDGVADKTDLDDDNDGILDTMECPPTMLWVTVGTPEPEEQNTINKLTALGYTVTVVDQNVGGNADKYDVTFIYEDVSSGTAAANVANLATTTKGIITSEYFLHDDILGGVPGATAAATFMTITNNTHPVTAGLPLGNYDIGQGASYAGNLTSGTVLANHANGNIGIAVWETGQAMETGTAPGRRTIVPFSNDVAPFNAAAEDILVNAIVWTAGNSSSCDTDSDGIPNVLDTDSDNDGCNDADEAYNDPNADSDNNGMYGSGTPTVDVDGKVVGAPYTAPVDTDSNGTFNFLEAASPITAQPQNQNIILGGTANFSVSVPGNTLSYQWYVSTDGGNNYTAITGETTGSLTVSGVSAAEDGNLYRVEVRDSNNVCSSQTSSSAILTTDMDSDGDGILDRADSDDDNDGILDTVECSLSVLWVTDGAPGPEEQNTINKLTALGYTVTVVDQNVGGNANSYDVTFIYEDVISGTAAANVANLATTTKGIITSEYALHGDILGGVPGSTADATFMTITNNTHPVTAGLPLGNYDIGQGASYAGNLTSGTVLANHANGSIGIAVWERGQAMETGTAPGRRTIVPFSNDVAPFNAAAEDILVNAIVWTAGNSSSCDTDSDGIPNVVDTDSDNDGCNDADETYADVNADADNNGMYGSGTPAVNPDGTVVAASYQTPADGDGNATYDFTEAGNAPLIITQPTDNTLCPGCTGTISVVASDSDTYQWQRFNGAVWVDLTDLGIHSGTSTNTLTISNPTISENGNRYRAIVSNSAYICTVETSDQAILTVVNVNTVITNRRITHRVKKN